MYRCLAILLSFVICSPAMAKVYEYTPNMQVSLGEAFDPRRPTESGGGWGCYETDIPANQTPRSILKANEGYSASEEEIAASNQIKVHASGEGKWGAAKLEASADYSSIRQKVGKKRAIFYQIGFTRTFIDKVIAKEKKLTETGDRRLQAIVKAKTPVERQEKVKIFWDKCFPRIVVGELRESSLSFVYIFTYTQESDVEKIKTAVSLAFKKGSNRGRTNVDIIDQLSTSAESVEVKWDLIVKGYRGLAAGEHASKANRQKAKDSLIDVLTQGKPGDIFRVREAIGQYAKNNMSYNTALPTQIFTNSAHRCCDELEDPESDNLSEVLYNRRSIFVSYLENIAQRYIRLQQIQDNAGKTYEYKNDESKDALRAEKAEIQGEWERITDLVTQCFEMKTTKDIKDKCQFDEIPIKTRISEYVDFEHMNFAKWSWNMDKSGEFRPNERKVVAEFSFWPNFAAKNVSEIEEVLIQEWVLDKFETRAREPEETIRRQVQGNGLYATEWRMKIPLSLDCRHAPECESIAANNAYLFAQAVKRAREKSIRVTFIPFDSGFSVGQRNLPAVNSDLQKRLFEEMAEIQKDWGK